MKPKPGLESHKPCPGFCLPVKKSLLIIMNLDFSKEVMLQLKSM